MAGTMLADLLQGRQNPWASLYDPGRVDARPSAKKFMKENFEVGKELAKGFVPAVGGSPDELGRGEAGVSLARQGRTAALRDESGALHALSARCTHMGCSVRFNDAERSWDCPCHGSRFALDVLRGPAVDGLERHDG